MAKSTNLDKEMEEEMEGVEDSEEEDDSGRNRLQGITQTIFWIWLKQFQTCITVTALKQGSLFFPKIEFFIKADMRGWSFL